MIVRRFVYDIKLGAVVELGQHKILVNTPGDEFIDAKRQHAALQSDEAGTRLRNAALEIADRRVHAHRRYGDERRWQ